MMQKQQKSENSLSGRLVSTQKCQKIAQFQVNRQFFVFWVNFFGLEHRNPPFPSNTATILKLSLLWTRSTPLTLPLLSWYVMTFCVFVRSRTCWLCFVAPIPRGLQPVALLAPNFRQLRRTCECHIQIESQTCFMRISTYLRSTMIFGTVWLPVVARGARWYLCSFFWSVPIHLRQSTCRKHDIEIWKNPSSLDTGAQI